ncbi:hypothetical protein Tco_1245588 [Tanacetum coccineum]
MTSAMTAMFKQHQVTLAPASVKAVEESCVTCGGAHSYRQCPALRWQHFSGFQDYVKDMFQQPQLILHQGKYPVIVPELYNQFRTPSFLNGFVSKSRFNHNRGNNFYKGMVECSALADLGASINLMPLSSKSDKSPPLYDPILSTSFSSLTPFEGGDFIFEEIKACLTNDSIPSGINDVDFDPEEDLTSDSRTRSSRILPFILGLSFLEGTDKLPVIISKELKDEEKAALLKVLKSHKRAIAWKISDIKGIDPSFCTHKILMETDDFNGGSTSKKGKIRNYEVIENEDNELIPTRLVTGWRVCIDYSDVFTDPRSPFDSSRLAIMDPPEDIMVRTTPLKKYLIPVSIGLLFTEMPMTWSHGVTLVNVKEKSRNVMKCLKMQFKFARSLTYGASILWDRSRLLEGTSTFS